MSVLPTDHLADHRALLQLQPQWIKKPIFVSSFAIYIKYIVIWMTLQERTG